MLFALIRPDRLFLLAASLALFPYMLWATGGGVSEARFDVGYQPVIVWLVAYVSFRAGSLLVPGSVPATAGFDLRPCAKRITTASVIATIALLAQIAWATKVYGTLPLFSYIAGNGMMDVGTANEMQYNAAFGQLGLLLVCTNVANGLILLLVILNGQQKRKRLFLLGALLFSALLSTLMNGKRQGVLICAVYLGVGLLIQSGSLQGVFKFVPFVPKRKSLRYAVLLGSVWLGFYLMGKLADIRTQGANGYSGVEETIRNLEFPLLNLSTQCEQAGGLGPYEFSARYPLQHLLPDRLIGGTFSDDISSPAKVEPTSPSGMFEMIHWGWGLLGIISYSLFLGALCTNAYNKAFRDLRYFLIYPYFAYALFTAHTYNHFLNVTFVPVPCLLFWFLTKGALVGRVSQLSTKRLSGSAGPVSLGSPLPQC